MDILHLASSMRQLCSLRPPKPIKPEIVIPVYERDLCKFKYTAKSISTFDPDHLLSDVRILWVSKNPVSQYQADMDEAKAAIKKTRNVWFHDFTQQMNSVKIGGWFAQMILKLKVASVVGSDFYVVPAPRLVNWTCHAAEQIVSNSCGVPMILSMI